MTSFTLAPLVRQALDRYRDRPALVDERGAMLTYGELAAVVARRRDALRALPSRRVAVVLPLHLDTAVWWLTALGTEDVAVTVVPPERATEERALVLEAFSPDAVVTEPGTDIGIDVGDPVATLGSASAPPGGPGPSVLARTSLDAPPRVARPGHPREVVVTTSGTTGVPKGVVHSDETLGRALWVTTMLRRETLGVVAAPVPSRLTMAELSGVVFDGAPDDLVFLNGMPVSTISGMTVLLQAIVGGATSIIAPSFSAPAYLDLIETRGVTNLALSPHMAQSLVRHQRRSPRRTGTVLATGIGGGPATADVCRDVEAVIGGVAAVGYGLTETAGPALMARYSEGEAARWRTVGRPAPGVGARLRGHDGPGELELHHPGLCHGYLDASGRLCPPPTNDGWFATGDMARRDDDGNFVVEARASDLIIRGGRNIDHRRIERVLDACPGVARTAVVGAPSAVPGEEDVCAVVETDGADTDLGAVRRYARDHLAPGERPQRYLEVDRLPMSHDLEVRRASLRSMIRNGEIAS